MVNQWIDKLLTNWCKICLAIYPTSIKLSNFIYLVIWSFINVNNSAALVSYLLARVSSNLLVSLVLSAKVFNFLLATVSDFC